MEHVLRPPSSLSAHSTTALPCAYPPPPPYSHPRCPPLPQAAQSLLGVANRVLIANAEQMAVASPSRRRLLAEAGTEEWVQGAVRRLGSVLASTLDPGAPPVLVTSVDEYSQRALVVSAAPGFT